MVVPKRLRFRTETKVIPPSVLTRYDVTGDPPLTEGAWKLTCRPLATEETPVMVGASANVAGVTCTEPDGVDEPAALIATTVNEYVDPFTRPETVHESCDVEQEFVPSPTTYFVITEPPVVRGLFHEMVAEPLPKTADTLVGAPGIVKGTTAALAGESGDTPRAFVARTTKV
jgi:hypothetical protein